MTFEPAQLAIAAGGVAWLAWNNRDRLKSVLGGLWPKATPAAPADPVAERVLLALELRAKCEEACPKAIEHIDAAFLHLLPGHVENHA